MQGNITRLMALEAGLPEEMPAFTIDLQCGSGLESIAVAAAKYKAGRRTVLLQEVLKSCSTAPVRDIIKPSWIWRLW